ncbi:MAG TPA: hypothetical protein P5244_00715 [Syntrophales bacterium]|nr:hypothetical protein [Syntrophales bacterium]
MNNIHEAIHWKTNNNPGVTVVNGSIRDWPSALGDQPTEETISTWITEYEAAEALRVLVDAAKTELYKTDITVLRCYEHGISVPETWINHRQALRDIVSGISTATVLPTTPDFPPGS